MNPSSLLPLAGDPVPNRFRATWRSTAMTALAVVVFYALGVLAWRTLWMPHFSGLRLGEPALVRPTALWREGQHGLLYRYGKVREQSLVIAGDSRVHRGIVLSKLEEGGVGPVYALTRPAAHTLDLLISIDAYPAGRMVLALSPLGLFNEESAVLQEPPPKVVLPILEPSVTPPFPRRLDTYTSDWADFIRRRIAEPMIPPAWRYGWFGGFGQGKFFDSFRHSLRAETHDVRLERLGEIQNFIAAMKAKGWSITCIRIPTYGPMRAIEDEAFDNQLFVTMCSELGVPYEDFGIVENATSDGSHLGVQGARDFSEQLAERLRSIPGMTLK